MENPLHASYYADHAVHATVPVTENRQLARDTFRLRFGCAPMARRILPGQFLMLRLAEGDDPLLGRAFALYDTAQDEAGEPAEIDIVYLVVGKLTKRLSQLDIGRHVQVWGPLGNGFLPRPTEHLVMVAGGIGQTPFLALAKEYLGKKQYGVAGRDVPAAQEVTLCYGARTAELLAGIEDFRNAGVEVHVSTDDGSRGHHGLVTEILQQVIGQSRLTPRIVCCGPEPMMHAVSQVAAQANVACQVSLESPMACGLGICFSCVAKVRDDAGEWDYKRTCVEGPVFDASRIQWGSG